MGMHGVQGITQQPIVEQSASVMAENRAINNNMREQNMAVNNQPEAAPQPITNPMMGNHINIEA